MFFAVHSGNYKNLIFFSFVFMNYSASISASLLLFCGLNSYWLSISKSFFYLWCLMLLMRSFCSTFPPKLRKLIGRYLEGSILLSWPGFPIGIFAIVHLHGKLLLFRHLLYKFVTCLGNLLNILRKISLVIPSIPVSFFQLKYSTICFISSSGNCASSRF